jgi:hypothetical protein
MLAIVDVTWLADFGVAVGVLTAVVVIVAWVVKKMIV